MIILGRTRKKSLEKYYQSWMGWYMWKQVRKGVKDGKSIVKCNHAKHDQRVGQQEEDGFSIVMSVVEMGFLQDLLYF